jgi:hypothetical protein
MTTAMQHAFKRAGGNRNEALLYSIAVDILRKSNLSPRAALNDFLDEVRDSESLLSTLISKRDTEPFAIRYLQSVALDMRGRDSRDMRDVGGKAISSDGKRSCAAHDNSAQAEGKANEDVPSKASTLLPSPTLDDGDGNGWPASNGKTKCASPSSSESSGTVSTSAPIKAKTPLPPAGASKRTLANMERVKKITTAFDSYLLRDGTPIGDLRYCQLDRFIGANAREAALLKLVRDYGIPADPNTRIRDIVSLETFEGFVQKSAELTDAK